MRYEQCSCTGEYIEDYITGRPIPDTDDERIRQKMERILIEDKGFAVEDIQVDHVFPLTSGTEEETGTAELVVLVSGRPFMTIRSAGAPW